MDIQRDIELSQYSTMRLGGKAKYLSLVESPESLKEVLRWATQQNLRVIMIGGGSNIVWRDEGFDGVVLVNKIRGFEASSNDDGSVLISLGAGENWDEIVSKCCDLGLSGIECLSLIPGSSGATPVQNVGAYGQELSSVVDTVEAFDTKLEQFVVLSPGDCQFTYRDSVFKRNPGRYYITGLNLRLTKGSITPPFYASLEHYLKDNNITDYSPTSIREAVINIRRAKLPDPAVVKNCGSFFANPIISNQQFDDLTNQLALEVPHWKTADGQVKLPAAWLIENVGYKDYHDQKTGIGTWPQQPLVLVNESAKSTADLLEFSHQVVSKVKDKFNIELVQEPLLLP